MIDANYPLDNESLASNEDNFTFMENKGFNVMSGPTKPKLNIRPQKQLAKI